MPPSQLLGLTPGSYEAYCFDEAVWYFGTTLTNELDKAEQAAQSRGKKRSSADKGEAARKKVLSRFLDEKGSNEPKFADPSAFFAK